MNCLSCGRGFCHECKKCRKGKCHPEEKKATALASPKKRRALKDPKSTGRKRAAELYPINKGDACEWQGKKDCGGGRRPIVGCLDGKQTHRHHGPVKDTTRNNEGNVHRICTACHVHWHELNDLIYDEREYGLLPHDPVAAEMEEIVSNQIAWLSGAMGKKYELASTKNKEKHVARNSVPASSSDENGMGTDDILLESSDGEDSASDLVS